MIKKAEREISRNGHSKQHKQANSTPANPGDTVLSSCESTQHSGFLTHPMRADTGQCAGTCQRALTGMARSFSPNGSVEVPV
jgi:hypothetical protein